MEASECSHVWGLVSAFSCRILEKPRKPKVNWFLGRDANPWLHIRQQECYTFTKTTRTTKYKYLRERNRYDVMGSDRMEDIWKQVSQEVKGKELASRNGEKNKFIHFQSEETLTFLSKTKLCLGLGP